MASRSFLANNKPQIGLNMLPHTAGLVTGDAINIKGYREMTLVMQSGIGAGTPTGIDCVPSFEESDPGGAWTAVTIPGLTALSAINSLVSQDISLEYFKKPLMRANNTIGFSAGTSIDVGMQVILSDKNTLPV